MHLCQDRINAIFDYAGEMKNYQIPSIVGSIPKLVIHTSNI